jgi:hypothetical protein
MFCKCFFFLFVKLCFYLFIYLFYFILFYFFGGFFMPPFEEEGHIALHLSVGQSVCRSVDQTISAQYLEDLSLYCYGFSYVGW